jgi:translation initiation factor IF-2
VRALLLYLAVERYLNCNTYRPVATVLLLRGDLTPGSHLIAGTVGCRVRNITDHTNKTLKSVNPGTAVTVSGWKELPKAGDELVQGRNEEEVKRAITNRKRQEGLNSVVEDVDAINQKRKLERERREAQLAALKSRGARPNASKPLFSSEVPEDGNRAKELKLVIKADVTGSAEAVAGALQDIGNDKAISKVISANVGDVTEGDLTLAKAIGGAPMPSLFS